VRRAIAIAAVATAAAIALPEAAIVAWITHPVRVEMNGGTPATTVEGARLLKIALGVAPAALLAAWWSLARLAPPRAVEPEARPGGRALVTLMIITLVAAVLRADRLGESLWYDELAALLGYAIHGVGPSLGNWFSAANHLPSTALVAGTVELVGVNELSVRLPAFLCGLACVPAAWWLGRVANLPRPEMAAAAMAAFPVAIVESTDARGYSLMILLATLATGLGVEAFRRGGAWRWMAYAAAVALGVWNHLAAVGVPLGHALLLGFALRGPGRRDAIAGLVALGTAAGLALVLWSPALPDLLATRGQFRGIPGETPSLAGPEMLRAIGGLFGSWWPFTAILGAILAITGLANELVGNPRFRTVFLAAIAGVPVVVALAALADSWLYARFLVFGLPATALAMAGLGPVTGPAGTRAAWLCLAGLLVASAVTVRGLPPRQPIREAVAAARELAGEGNPVGVVGLRDQVTLFYAEPLGVPLVDLGDRGARLATGEIAAPATVLVLYPDLLPPATAAALDAAGFATERRLDGWVDWGRGAIEVRRKR
jgi:mannosyltransferase